MKSLSTKIIVSFLSLSLLMFSSCEDDNGDGNKQSDIVGTWTIVGTEVDITVGDVSLVDYLVNNYEIPVAQAQALVTLFTADYAASGTLTINADNTYRADVDGDVETGTWSLSSDGKTLTVTTVDEDMNQYTDILSIVKLTANELVLELPAETEDMDFDDDGIYETTMKIVAVMTFSR